VVQEAGMSHNCIINNKRQNGFFMHAASMKPKNFWHGNVLLYISSLKIIMLGVPEI